MEAVRAGMPVACVKHEAGGGHTVKDIHMDNFTISVGGHDLILDGSVTLSFGRHYGEVSRLLSLFSLGLFGLTYLSISIDIGTCKTIWESLWKPLMACP